MINLTVLSFLLASACRRPHAVALAESDREWTYAEWLLRVQRLAGGIASLGVRPLDRVGILAPTSELWVTTFYACQYLGAIAVPINHRLAATEVANVLCDSGARVLVCPGATGGKAVAAASMAGIPPTRLISSRPGDCDGEVCLDYEALCAAGPSGLPPFQAASDHLTSIMYTSGTTGRPKGVLHTNGNDVAIATNCAVEYGLRRDDSALHIAPLHHVGGLQAFFLPHVMVGAANVLHPSFSAVDVISEITERRVTTMFAVPTQIARLEEHPEWEQSDLSTIRLITTGGAAISDDAIARVIAKVGAVIVNGYGMTEASLSLLLHADAACERPASCGKPTLITSCRVIRRQAEGRSLPTAIVPDGEVGELIVRGPHVTPGYWNNDAATNEAICGGWLYTGDLFSRDPDGFYTFHGRIDDLIVTGGENVYPREVENVLARCPGVKEVAVVGVPDERWGAAVAAFIVRDRATLTAAMVDEYCRESGELALFKRPRFIEFLQDIPRNASGKVLRGKLGDAARSCFVERK